MSAQIELLRHGDTAQRSYRGQLDDALSELGVRHVEMPATPERVWRAIREARKGVACDA